MAETPEEQQRRIALAQEEYEQAQLRREELEREGASREKIAKAIAAQAKAEEDLARARGISGEALRAFTRDTEAATEASKRATEAVEASKKVTESFENQLKKNIKTLTGVTEQSDTLIGSFINMSKETGGVIGAFKKMGETLSETMTAQNVATSIAQKYVEGTIGLVMALDSATAGFAKATGLGKAFNDQITSLESDQRRFGVTASESAAAFGSLVDGLSGFALMGDDVQGALATEVAQLSELGVTSSDAAGSFNSLMRSFGMTAGESQNLTKETEVLAQELGISVGEAVNNLNSALPQLAALSKDQVGPAFKELQKQAVETGMAVGDLISIADGFMTFDDAATAAGNLNAVLGTQTFDTMSLLEAQMEGPQAFIETFRSQLQSSATDFEDMDVFQKKAIANAAGLTSEQLNQLMMSENITEEQKREAEQREKNLKAAMTLKDELMALAAELSVALSPILTVVKGIVSGFASINRSIKETVGGGAFGTLLSGAAVVGGAYGGMKLGRKLLSKVTGGKFGGPKVKQKINPDGSTNVKIVGKAKTDVTEALEKSSFFKGLKNKLMDKGRSLLGGIKEKAMDFGRNRVGNLMDAGTSVANLAKSIPKPKKGKKNFFMRGLDKVKGLGNKIPGLGRLAGLGRIGGRFVPGLGQVMMAYDAYSLAKSAFAEGTDSTPKGPALVGEKGPEVVVPPPGSAVINNSAMVKNAMMGMQQGAMMGAMVKAVSALADRPIEVSSRIEMDSREFGRSVNKHFGAPGSKAANSSV